MTITGENFSEVITDNPVMVGDLLCRVSSASTTQIVCRIEGRSTDAVKEPDWLAQAPFEGKVDVFLKVAEAADCRAENECKFTFENPQSSLTLIQATYDIALATHIITLTGEGLDSNADVAFIADDIPLVLQERSDTQLKFALEKSLDRYSTNLSLEFSDGLPSGHWNIIGNRKLWLSPRIYSVEPNYGSAGGTKLTIKGSAFGANMDTSEWIIEGKNGSNVWETICDEVTIVEYGVLTCTTIAGSYYEKQIRVTTPDW